MQVSCMPGKHLDHYTTGSIHSQHILLTLVSQEHRLRMNGYYWIQFFSFSVNQIAVKEYIYMHGCSTVHPSWAQSTGHAQIQQFLCAPPRVEGQTPTCSPSRHEHSHKRDKPPQHSWVSSMVVIPPAHTEATSFKWPWEGSSTRCFCPTHRHSHSRSGQQQQHQSPPQRGPP